MDWLGITIANDENVFMSWKKWGRKFGRIVPQKFSYACLAAIVLIFIWHARKHSLCDVFVIHLDRLVKNIKQEVSLRAKQRCMLHGPVLIWFRFCT